MRRIVNTQGIDWFLDLAARDQLDFEPPYQRRSVWNRDYRQRFIETILRGFPSPAVFLEKHSRPGLPVVYRIIDGKQRLQAIVDFAQDRETTGTYLAEEGLSGCRFSDLPEELATAFRDYRITVEEIASSSPTELGDAFDRLNRNVMRLTPQELRHAQWTGEYISLMEQLADHPFCEEVGFSTPARIRRMKDVEFVSELFALGMCGILDGQPEVLDELYAELDEEIPDKVEHLRTFEAVIGELRRLPLDWRKTRWRNQADLYTLWATYLELMQSGAMPAPEEAAKRLTKLDGQMKAERRPKAVSEYADLVRQGSNKQENRQRREEILRGLLAG